MYISKDNFQLNNLGFHENKSDIVRSAFISNRALDKVHLIMINFSLKYPRSEQVVRANFFLHSCVYDEDT